jgi:chromosome segregation ATPase
VRRDLEEFKKRYSDATIEVNELRKERDALKLEKNDMIIKQAKEIEEERNLRRSLTTELDKLKFRTKCLEDDLQKAQLKAEKRSQEANATSTEKTSLLSLLKEKEILLDSFKRQLTELREELHQREDDLDKAMRR